jgi:hypothetical protein
MAGFGFVMGATVGALGTVNLAFSLAFIYFRAIEPMYYGRKPDDDIGNVILLIFAPLGAIVGGLFAACLVLRKR